MLQGKRKANWAEPSDDLPFKGNASTHMTIPLKGLKFEKTCNEVDFEQKGRNDRQSAESEVNQ